MVFLNIVRLYKQLKKKKVNVKIFCPISKNNNLKNENKKSYLIKISYIPRFCTNLFFF